MDPAWGAFVTSNRAQPHSKVSVHTVIVCDSCVSHTPDYRNLNSQRLGVLRRQRPFLIKVLSPHAYGNWSNNNTFFLQLAAPKSIPLSFVGVASLLFRNRAHSFRCSHPL